MGTGSEIAMTVPEQCRSRSGWSGPKEWLVHRLRRLAADALYSLRA